MLHYLPSTIAVSAIICAYGYLDVVPEEWIKSLPRLAPTLSLGDEVEKCSSALMLIFGTQFPELAPSQDSFCGTGNSFLQRCLSPTTITI